MPAIVIAAGGDGRRIGGSKPLRHLGGRPLLDHAIAIARAQSDCIALAVRDTLQVSAEDIPVLSDARDGCGPISALESAFRFAEDQGRDAVLLIGCDQPFLPHDLAARLSAVIGDHKAAMPISAGRYQPLAALWRPDLGALAAYIAGGGQSIWRFAAVQGAVHLDWQSESAPDPFANINDPSELAAAEKYFADLLQ